MNTEQVLIKMLKENTGAHFLDSGGAYGRNHERNSNRDFKNEPVGELRFNIYTARYDNKEHLSMDSSISTFHFLNNFLEYEPELQRKFNGYANRKANEDKNWLSLAESFVEDVIVEENEEDVEGPWTTNTYNHDNILDQVIQYVCWESNDGKFMLLQIHGGCDVRGGYTKPRVFKVYDESPGLYDDARATIYCTGYAENSKQETLPNVDNVDDGHHYWYTENGGYSWENESGKKLEDYEFTSDENEKGKGKFYVDEDGNGYCPKCGAVLEIGF